MNEQQQAASVRLNKVEREAIEFAKFIFKGPKKGEKDPLMKVERNAINKLKVAWEMLKK